jgi:adenosylcobinamide-phosphate synthase
MDWRPLAVALVLDATLGEPPAAVHPVVWMGRLLRWLETGAPTQSSGRLAYGGLVAVLAPLGWALMLGGLARWLPWPLQGVLLKPTLAGRALLEAGGQVHAMLAAGRLVEARARLRSLVSRPTDELDAALVSAAGIESLAENLGDTWVAPLLAYSVAGVGGAYAYRAANTADAMWGYRGSPYEWLGKAPARLDDLLSWLPARAAAAAIVLVSDARRRSFEVWRSDAQRTASPNAGHPMAAAAGAVGVRLEKAGHYMLNASARPPSADDLEEAFRLIRRAMALTAAVALALARRRGR